MNEEMMPKSAEPRKILEAVVSKKIPALMSYRSKDRWHVSKVLLTELGAGRFFIEVSPGRKPQPLNIQLEQEVGISIKYGYGKFVFETTVTALEPSAEPSGRGRIALAVPEKVEMIQRRSYFRVEVPEELKVNTVLWYSGLKREHRCGTELYWKGRLIDISAGGLQIALDAQYREAFKEGQTLGLRFTPQPYEEPLMFNAQVRSALLTADKATVCLGLQIVGLEASTEGQATLGRLVDVVERYHQMNQSSIKQQNIQTISA